MTTGQGQGGTETVNRHREERPSEDLNSIRVEKEEGDERRPL